MPVVVIANPKKGVGKRTLATQVAGRFAHDLVQWAPRAQRLDVDGGPA